MGLNLTFNSVFFKRMQIKFIHSEKATKICRNLHILLEILYWHPNKFGDFVLFLWPSENI